MTTVFRTDPESDAEYARRQQAWSRLWASCLLRPPDDDECDADVTTIESRIDGLFAHGLAGSAVRR
jgi:hypothetical protein